MKKSLVHISAIICLVLILGFGEVGAKKQIVIGFSQTGAECAWRVANSESIILEAKKRGFKLKFSDAEHKQENQIKAIRSYITQKVDVIGFSPVVETGWEEVLREAKQAKIPVILTVGMIDLEDTSLWATLSVPISLKKVAGLPVF